MALSPSVSDKKGNDMKTLPHLFFGVIFAISGGTIAGGLVGEWWAFAALVPVGAFVGWKAGSKISS